MVDGNVTDIDALILNALSSASNPGVLVYGDQNLPIYGYMPDFGENEPSDYIVYTYYDTPQLYADDIEHQLEYTVTINIFTQSPLPELEKYIKKCMKSQGFTYQGSTSPDFSEDYPGKYRKNQNYKIEFLEEE